VVEEAKVSRKVGTAEVAAAEVVAVTSDVANH